MNVQLVSVSVLAYLAGFATPYVLHWIDWHRGRRRMDDEWL